MGIDNIDALKPGDSSPKSEHSVVEINDMMEKHNLTRGQAIDVLDRTKRFEQLRKNKEKTND